MGNKIYKVSVSVYFTLVYPECHTKQTSTVIIGQVLKEVSICILFSGEPDYKHYDGL